MRQEPYAVIDCSSACTTAQLEKSAGFFFLILWKISAVINGNFCPQEPSNVALFCYAVITLNIKLSKKWIIC